MESINNKKGISEVVVWIIGLALVLVLIVIVWQVISTFTNKQAETTESAASCLDANIGIQSVTCEATTRSCTSDTECTTPGYATCASGRCEGGSGNPEILSREISGVTIKRDSGSGVWENVKVVINGEPTATIPVPDDGLEPLESELISITPITITEDAEVKVAPVVVNADGTERTCPESRIYAVKLSSCA